MLFYNFLFLLCMSFNSSSSVCKDEHQQTPPHAAPLGPPHDTNSEREMTREPIPYANLLQHEDWQKISLSPQLVLFEPHRLQKLSQSLKIGKFYIKIQLILEKPKLGQHCPPWEVEWPPFGFTVVLTTPYWIPEPEGVLVITTPAFVIFLTGEKFLCTHISTRIGKT